MIPNMINPNKDEILERAKHYYGYHLSDLKYLISVVMSPYDICRGNIREDIKSSAIHTNRDTLTKPEAILLLLKLTEREYEAIKTLPHDQIPLYVNDFGDHYPYPDIKNLFLSRLKSG